MDPSGYYNINTKHEKFWFSVVIQGKSQIMSTILF